MNVMRLLRCSFSDADRPAIFSFLFLFRSCFFSCLGKVVDNDGDDGFSECGI